MIFETEDEWKEHQIQNIVEESKRRIWKWTAGIGSLLATGAVVLGFGAYDSVINRATESASEQIIARVTPDVLAAIPARIDDGINQYVKISLDQEVAGRVLAAQTEINTELQAQVDSARNQISELTDGKMAEVQAQIDHVNAIIGENTLLLCRSYEIDSDDQFVTARSQLEIIARRYNLAVSATQRTIADWMYTFRKAGPVASDFDEADQLATEHAASYVEIVWGMVETRNPDFTAVQVSEAQSNVTDSLHPTVKKLIILIFWDQLVCDGIEA